jgi:hypothetical protein
MLKLIGLCGVAGSGKDTFFTIASEILSKNNVNTLRHSLALQLKKELSPFLKEQLNIDPFTENRDEKTLIRGVMSAWGQLRRKQTPSYWLNSIEKDFDKNVVNFITDVRYENEVDYIHNKGGAVLYIERFDKNMNVIAPANLDEEMFTMPLKAKSNNTIKWNTVEPFNINNTDIHSIVLNALKQLF